MPLNTKISLSSHFYAKSVAESGPLPLLAYLSLLVSSLFSFIVLNKNFFQKIGVLVLFDLLILQCCRGREEKFCGIKTHTYPIFENCTQATFVKSVLFFGAEVGRRQVCSGSEEGWFQILGTYSMYLSSLCILPDLACCNFKSFFWHKVYRAVERKKFIITGHLPE
jgi:hypothetical protein